jgi:hypothetical protein
MRTFLMIALGLTALVVLASASKVSSGREDPEDIDIEVQDDSSDAVASEEVAGEGEDRKL